MLRDGGQGNIVEDAVTLNILSGYEFRPFWLSWDRGVVCVGEGARKGKDPFLVWHVPENKRHGVNCVAVSTGPGSEGEWEFVEYISEYRMQYLIPVSYSSILPDYVILLPFQRHVGLTFLFPTERLRSI